MKLIKLLTSIFKKSKEEVKKMVIGIPLHEKYQLHDPNQSAFYE